MTEKNIPHIVSSEHLASENGWQMSELEYGMIMAYNAFNRWMVRCMTAVGYSDFNGLDILVLHNVNHRQREKRLVDVAFMLNVEDSHTINYSLKKLMKSDLIQSEKRGKEMFYSTTPKGAEVCAEYRKVRDVCLLESAAATDRDFNEISKTATVLRSVSGLYDQAARAAASI
ncbi:winged helix DNA-binding protein [Sneathiella chinensis]|uniref:Transcriptional regulator n=1 Tax=Sneathiella chinensis TaxID=349750 RepID=A0ABQ5U484_9PROT|nr:winged helix DNA-binding protein [Sneathiella chinensis]GLQ06892.1 transcriptional regulator [Sneathiella chinensis]